MPTGTTDVQLENRPTGLPVSDSQRLSGWGAVLGGTAALVVMRLRRAQREFGGSLAEQLVRLPQLVQDDAQRVLHAARGAVTDGSHAMHEQQERIDKVIGAQRRTQQEP